MNSETTPAYRSAGQFASKPYQILCLSGGGYRGLYTATLLEKLEDDAGKPLSEVFDLIAGTSIGGILAIGLAAGVTAKSLREAFERNADHIFPQHKRIRGKKIFPRFASGIFKARYPQTGLRDTLREILKETLEKPFHSLANDVLVDSVNLTSRAAQIFRSSDPGCATAVIDVALSTSAAPTFFPEHMIDSAIFVDGGLVANAPDMIAVLEALKTERLEDLRVISIGTAGREGAKAYRTTKRLGFAFGGKSTFLLTLDAQEQLSVQLTRALLGERYVRFDELPSKDEKRKTGLDVTGVTASATLKLMANRTWQERHSQHQAFLRDVLNRNKA